MLLPSTRKTIVKEYAETKTRNCTGQTLQDDLLFLQAMPLPSTRKKINNLKLKHSNEDRTRRR